MSFAIQIENLSKKFLIPQKGTARYQTLRESIFEIFTRKKNVSLKEFWALQDISLDIEQGEKIGIIGKNGAGKSTLLKILSRIIDPTQGKIKIKGRVTSLLEVGTGFHPELTGRENIFLNGAILGMSKIEIQKKFDDIVAFAEISEFLDTPVKRYSSGMYVRLAFAVAAHLDCEILIVDEVLAVGDQEFQKKCLGKMSDLSQQQGRTLLFVSHNIAAIKALCSKCLYIKQGKMQFLGQPEEAIIRYSNENIISEKVSLENLPRDPRLPQWAKFVDITVISDGVTNPQTIHPKHPVTVQLKIYSERDVPEKISLGLRVQDSVQCLLWCHSLYEKKSFSLKKGINTIECNFSYLHLTGGNYYLKCWIYFAIENTIIDYLEDVYHFSTYNLDPFETGISLTQQQHCIYNVPYSWNKVD